LLKKATIAIITSIAPSVIIVMLANTTQPTHFVGVGVTPACAWAISCSFPLRAARAARDGPAVPSTLTHRRPGQITPCG
jgi:hypothetical protein